jgi:hypothetical protein
MRGRGRGAPEQRVIRHEPERCARDEAEQDDLPGLAAAYPAQRARAPAPEGAPRGSRLCAPADQ